MKRVSKLNRIWMLAMLVIVAGSMVYAGSSDLKAKFQMKADEISKAVLANDIPAMIKMYVDDAISLPSYSPMLRGKTAIAKQSEADKNAGMKLKSFKLTTTDVFGSGDLYIEIGTYSLVIELPDMPGPIPDKGKYLTVWQKQADGSWKIKADTWNTDINPKDMMKNMQ